jgi:hypothetical protein
VAFGPACDLEREAGHPRSDTPHRRSVVSQNSSKETILSMSDEPKKPGEKRGPPDEDYGEVREPETFRIERLLPGPIERVWSYLTEPEKRRRWFGAGPMELRAGGRVKLQFRFSELSREKTPPTKGDECELTGESRVTIHRACLATHGAVSQMLRK